MTRGVGKRVAVNFAVMVLIIVAHNLVLFHYLGKTDTYGAFLELAGRQRFLSQRLGSLLESARTGEHSHIDHAIESTVVAFDETLDVLEQGGELLERRYAPAPPAILDDVHVQRDVFRRLRQHLRTDGAPAALMNESRTETKRLVEELTSSSFGLIDAIESWRQQLRRGLLYSIVGTSLLALIILMAALRSAWANIVTPVRELRDEALRVSENGFRHHNPGNEIDVVSTVVTEMSQSVGRLRYERKRVEQKLRRVQADYQLVFDNAVAGIFQFNAAGEVILANPAMARILGYACPADLANSITNGHRELFADPDHEARVAALVQEDGVVELQTQMIRKDGSVLWVLESSAIIRSKDLDYCYEGVIVDITEMKKAQEQLRELSGLLLDSQERERRRIARELHDSTGQVLAALEMNLGRLRKCLTGASDALSITGELASQCSREIRSMSYLLHPPLLDELGLVYAVRDYADGFAKRSGIDVELELPADMERLSQDEESALFRVIQEALTNIHRHAESPVAKIGLARTSDGIVVQVEDAGRGIPAELLGSEGQSLSRMGVGMRGMEERLRQLGGRLTVTSSSRGTVVRGELRRTVRNLTATAAAGRSR